MTIYTDGSCLGNPGPGGFGVIVVDNDVVIDAYSEREPQTTNNREEMKAIIYMRQNTMAQKREISLSQQSIAILLIV